MFEQVIVIYNYRWNVDQDLLIEVVKTKELDELVRKEDEKIKDSDDIICTPNTDNFIGLDHSWIINKYAMTPRGYFKTVYDIWSLNKGSMEITAQSNLIKVSNPIYLDSNKVYEYCKGSYNDNRDYLFNGYLQTLIK